MTVTKNKFIHDADQIAFNKKHRSTIKFNISRYDAAVERGKKLYSNLELARQRGSWIKERVINNLHDYLIQFEQIGRAHV